MTFGSVFGRAFSPTFQPSSQAVSGGDTWWDLNGTITSCVAAYQPKGAASYAASKINLANPGTYNATDGSAPSWDTSDGWTGDGSKYLDTGISTVTSSWSFIVRYSDIPDDGATFTSGYLLGAQLNTGYFGLMGWRSESTYNHQFFYNAGSSWWNPSDSASGIAAVAGADGYFNGTDKVNLTANSTAKTNFFILMMGNLTTNKAKGKIQALAIYNETLTSTQIGNLTTAMAAL